MKKRALTSLYIVLATALAILSKFLPNQIGTYIFDVFVIFICYIACMEMGNILTLMDKQPEKVFSSFYIVLNYIIMLICTDKLALGYICLIQLGALVVYNFIVSIYAYATNKEAGYKSAFKTALYTLINCVYPTFMFGLMLQINHIDNYANFANFSMIFIILIFAVTMLTDTFAYLIGSAFKGPKLAPKISPNKTISGAIGGLLGGVIGAMLVFVVVRCTGWQQVLSLHHLAWWHFALIGFVSSAIGQAGDLFESFLKRKANIKDAGNIFPGHGGMLDRIDALTVVTTFVFIVLLCLLW